MTTAEALNVSRETFAALQDYAQLLEKWNPRINLVSRNSLGQLWQRHIQDSLQLADLAPNPCKHWVDLGSGGGFPGLVIAILAKETGSPQQVTLVESDMRKATFLRTVIRELSLPATVINARIEQVDPLNADVLSARALADLSDLLGFAERHLAPSGTALFPKGIQWEKELFQAQSQWNFHHRVDKSLTENGPVILSITGVSRV